MIPQIIESMKYYKIRKAKNLTKLKFQRGKWELMR